MRTEVTEPRTPVSPPGVIEAKSHGIIVRILYHPFGLAFSLTAILAAWLLRCLIISMPLGVWLYGKVPWLASLHRG